MPDKYKLEEQWERRENAHELHQAQEAAQRHEDETKAEKVKVVRQRMAEAHRAKQQGSSCESKELIRH